MPRVMIVDDDRTMLSLLKMLLELDGFEVVNVVDRSTVLQAIRTEGPDIVLMDVFLSDADGVEVLSQIRASQDLAEVRVVMTSGMDLADRCAAAGANAFLLKPYSPELLISTLKEHLSITGAGTAPPSAQAGI